LHEGSVLFLDQPSLEEAIRTVKDALRKERFLLVVGSCRVDYRGRASSTLGLGERVVVVKGDGSVLVHRAWDVQPVNWQPPGSVIQASLRNGRMVLRSIRLKPKETLEVEFERVYGLVVANLVDKAEFAMYASEKDMQRVVMANPELVEEGLKPIMKEKSVEPGFIDVYAIDRAGNIVVIELKRRSATGEDAMQLVRYVEDVKRRSGGRGVRGILAAPSASKKALLVLEKHGLEFKQLTPQKCAEMLREPASRRLTEYL